MIRFFEKSARYYSPSKSYWEQYRCATAKLVIELDGSQHYDTSGIESDAPRDVYLCSLGLTFKRYSNADIKLRFDSVCENISDFIYRRNS